jgi:hypothetical protein
LTSHALSLYHWRIHVVGPLFRTLFPNFLEQYRQELAIVHESQSSSSSSPPPSFNSGIHSVLESVVELGMEKEFLKAIPPSEQDAVINELESMKITFQEEVGDVQSV